MQTGENGSLTSVDVKSMRDRALIVTEFPAKSFILNRIAEEDERSRGPESRRDLERAGKGWEGVRATGSSINSREMHLSRIRLSCFQALSRDRSTG